MPLQRSAQRRSAILAVVLLTVAGLGAAAFAQRLIGKDGRRHLPNAKYDGRFTFVRINYDTAPGGYWYRGQPAWMHGYPVAEENLMKIMNEVSYLGANDEQFNSLALDDPELFKYPLVYLIEVSWWKMTDRERTMLRAYLDKGGFVIVDDFKAEGDFGSAGWQPFAENMKRVIPEGRFVDMDTSHPIFHSFFEIGTLNQFPQAYNAGQPVFRGLYEDNDPSKRLMMIVNYNTDISQYWEWSGRGLRPFDETNEAYKLGVNYIIYGMTH
ncbi:MAG TPA: DUF4159 domain-containing protein [Vicinamibacterales bacterium]|jgi:hypothetical protein|nr:DUF4159 domain-containing protein [Vicinamibacterales bacterium]